LDPNQPNPPKTEKSGPNPWVNPTHGQHCSDSVKGSIPTFWTHASEYAFLAYVWDRIDRLELLAAFSNGVQQKHSQLAGNENNDGYCSNVSLYTDWPSCCRRCCKYDRPTAAKYSLLRNANVLISQPDIAIFFSSPRSCDWRIFGSKMTTTALIRNFWLLLVVVVTAMTADAAETAQSRRRETSRQK